MIPDRETQNAWITSAYQKMHALDFKGLASQVNDTLNPVARKRIRQEKFERDVQGAFDGAFKELVPEILAEMVDEHPTWLPLKEDMMLMNLYQNMPFYSSSEPIPDYISRRPAASA